MNTYDIGDLVRCTGKWTTSAGAATDPAAIVFKFKDPSDNTTTYTYGVDAEVVKDGTGEYHVDVSIDESGMWHFRWESTGAGQAAEESQFLVKESEFD